MISKSYIKYEVAMNFMERRADLIYAGRASELIWFLEHPHVYTAGSSATDAELLRSGDVPVFKTPRGGRYTYHGPGQRVIYVMLDLNRFNKDIRYFIKKLEEILIHTFNHFQLNVYAHRERIGLWIDTDGREEKIGAIGLKVKKWISLHGVAINIDTDLSYFNGIIPCGLANYNVTSIRKIRETVTLEEFDKEFLKNFQSKICDLKKISYLDLNAAE